MIKAIVFDIGGIFIQDPWEWMLLNSPENIADKFNLCREDVFRIGGQLWKKYECVTNLSIPLNIQEKEYWQEFLSALPDYPKSLTEEYLIRETDRYLVPIEPLQIRQMLDLLVNKNIILGICSNNTDFWFAREWEKLKFQKYFPEKNIILSNRVGFSKSSEGHEMFKALKDALECEFEEIVFVDDRKHNIEFAKQCGIRGIYIENHTLASNNELTEILTQILPISRV